MKTFFVKTGSDLSEMLLHSTLQGEAKTTNLDEANAIFEKEVVELEKAYINENNLSYCPTDEESTRGIYCEIVAFEVEEDGAFDPAGIESVRLSDRYYQK